MVEAESSFTGKVIQENASLGKLVVLLDSGELQNFFRRDLTSITVLKECGEVNMSGCGRGDQSSLVGKKMQDNWPKSKLEEVRSVDDRKQLQRVTPTRETFTDKQCVRSEEEMREIFAGVRPELPVLPRRIERPGPLERCVFTLVRTYYFHLNVLPGFLHPFAFLGGRAQLPPSELAQGGDEPTAGCCPRGISISAQVLYETRFDPNAID